MTIYDWKQILSVFTEMGGVIAVEVGASRRHDGPMGKNNRLSKGQGTLCCIH